MEMPAGDGTLSPQKEKPMAFRPNYQQARGDRNRAKEQKKQEKLRRRDEDAARRKAERGDGGASTAEDRRPDSKNRPE